MADRPIAKDFAIGIHAVCIELFGVDTPAMRKRIYRLRSEVPAHQRLPGLTKLGGQIALNKPLARQFLLFDQAAK